MTTQIAVENRFIRIAGRDENAPTVLARAEKAGDLPVEFADRGDQETNDYAIIELALAVSEPTEVQADVDTRLGFGGWMPAQRGQFLAWLTNPCVNAPAPFQALYLANLEIRLFEDEVWRNDVQAELLALHAAPAWREQRELARVTGLAYWLRQDGDGLAAWLAECPPRWIGIGLGWQALLGTPLRTEQVGSLLHILRPAATQAEVPPLDTLALHLDSLTNALGKDPLAHVLADLDPATLTSRPWRGVHRDVRLLLPQPAIINGLRPLLLEIEPNLLVIDDIVGKDEADGKDDAAPEQTNWHIILEFHQSRSEYFQMALELAKRNETFTQIMDEDRRLVYRVMFRKGRSRNFWRLWEYVKGWSSTRVYIHGEEVESWKVYPYSQFMR